MIWRLAIASVCCALLASAAVAQGIFRYKDSNGNWVFSDRKPADTEAQILKIKVEPVAPRILIESVRDGSRVILRAVNECICSVEFGVRVQDVHHVRISPANDVRTVVAPQSNVTLVEIAPTGAGDPSYRYVWDFMVGVPNSEHRPSQPYRVPYAVGQTFKVTQAYPDTFTHGSRESRYAVDIALPDQTAVVAARSGRVINVAHEHYRGGAKREMVDEANFVEILHDDGTIGMYAHLHWDSIRVSPGQRVSRGEYIANSGNTGFTTGPHLHFVVFRNVGMRAESVPVEFAGSNDAPISPRRGMMLRAY